MELPGEYAARVAYDGPEAAAKWAAARHVDPVRSEREIVCRYSVLRFIPDAIRGEFLHVGIVLERQDTGQLYTAFGSPDRPTAWTTAFRTDVYEALIEDMAERIAVGTTLDRLARTYSGQYELTEPYLMLSADPAESAEELRVRLVDAPTTERWQR